MKRRENDETALQRAIVQRLAWQYPELLLMRNNSGATRVGHRLIRYGLGPGSADLIGCLRGRFVALEVKTEKGRCSSDQRHWLAEVERHGGLTAVVRSPDQACEMVRYWLEEMDFLDALAGLNEL